MESKNLMCSMCWRACYNLWGLFGIWSLIYLSFLYFERYNRSLKYEAAIKEIELNNLKSQLNPHFIFNALNSIRALVNEDPLKSKKAITQLSNISPECFEGPTSRNHCFQRRVCYREGLFGVRSH